MICNLNVKFLDTVQGKLGSAKGTSESVVDGCKKAAGQSTGIIKYNMCVAA